MTNLEVISRNKLYHNSKLLRIRALIKFKLNKLQS